MTPTLQETIAYFAGEVVNAFIWTGAVVGVLGLIVLGLGLCRMAALSEGKVASDLEIDR